MRLSDFYKDLEAVVSDVVCLNFDTSFSQVYDAVEQRFGESGSFEQIVIMAEAMYDEIINDLEEFLDEDENYIN